MAAPLVSIVTPSFNQAAYLERTIRSVLAQDYPHIEYLVVDGGSTDGSVEVIRRHAERLAWWVSEPDAGQADAINKGMARAQGEIVAWLNSDDLYRPGAVRQAVAAFRAHPEAAFVFANATSVDAQGRPLNDMVFGPWGLADLLAFRIICQPAVFMRRAVFEQAGGLDTDYHFLLDHHLWIRMARLAPMVYVPSFWAFARHHPAAKNVAQAARFGEEAFRILRWAARQPDLQPLLQANRRRIQAGAHRFAARYLLDGGQAGQALAHYLRALALHPPTALAEGHRMLFAALSLLGLGALGEVYYRWKARQRPPSTQQEGIDCADDLYV